MTQAQQLMEGLKLILEVDPKAETAAEHDIVYVGGKEELRKLKRRLDALDWHWDDQFECWAFFT